MMQHIVGSYDNCCKMLESLVFVSKLCLCFDSIMSDIIFGSCILFKSSSIQRYTLLENTKNIEI